MNGDGRLTDTQITQYILESKQTLEAHTQQIKSLFGNCERIERSHAEIVERIEDLRKIYNTINDINITLERLNGVIDRQAMVFDNLRDDMRELNTRIDLIEQKPTRRIDGVINSLFGGIAGAVGVAILYLLAGQLFGG